MMETKLCVTVVARTTDEAIAVLRELPPGVSMAEIRLDYIDEPEVERLCRARDREIIATCRPGRQGGRFTGEESERLRILQLAAASGAEFIDLEYDCFDKAGLLSVPGECRLIVSYHDFDGMPKDLTGLYKQLAGTGADIVKIAVTARTILDAIRMLELVKGVSRPIIGLCMGEEGVISRILAPKVGAFLSYASVAKGSEAAPGQVSYDEMLGLYRFCSISRGTRVYGVIANPVAHSMSPAIHNAAFEATRLDAVYLPLKVDDVREFIPTFKGFDVGGYSVTIPHKEAVIGLMDEVEPLVEEIGAMNTVVVRGGRMLGYNTDVRAAVGAIKRACVRAGWGDGDDVLKGRKLLLVGAGGAGRALAYGLKEAGAELVIANRTFSRAEKLACETGAVPIPLDRVRDVDYAVLVNTTSVGMYPEVDAMPVPVEILKPGTVVFDAVYNPIETRLLRCALDAGCVTASGFDWFVGQAVAQFELWTEMEAPREVMEEVVRNRLGTK